FLFQAEDGIRDDLVTGVQTCALPISLAVHGGEVSTSIAELAQTADVILSCLTNDRSVQDVYYGAAGVLANARPGAVMLEMSTVLPRTSRDLQQGAAQDQLQVLDTAISGSTPAAEQGSLILLVGGDAELFQAAQPLFNAVSARSFHMVPAGAGTAMKLVVNTLLS